MLSLLSEFRTGFVDGVKVRLGRLQNLVASSCLEHLDFLHHVDTDEMDIKVFSELKNDHIGYQSLTDIPVMREIVEEKRDFVVRIASFIGRSLHNASFSVVICTRGKFRMQS